MTELRTQIFFFLKSNGPTDAHKLACNILDFPPDEVRKEIDDLLKDGLLKIDNENKLHISLYLDAPKIAYRKDGLYNYQLLQEKKEVVPAQSRPPVWINENIYAIPRRDQGERGTCVGQATAYAADLNNMKLTSWRPDLKQTIRNDVVISNDIKFIKDTLPDGCASAECAYVTSREVGNIRRDQLGSFLDYAVKAWQKVGICSDSLWWTPKSATFNNFDAYPGSREKCTVNAELHTIEGYAATQDFESIKDAIYKNGFVLMAINVYSNWLDNNCEGLFPDPKGNTIGSHALCWVGYDENNLYCLHSWSEWSLLGGISKAYFDKAHLTPFIPLDTYEVDAAKQLYSKLTITSDVTSNIQINSDVFRKTKKAVGAFDANTPITVKVTPTLAGMPTKDQILTITQDTELAFTFATQLPCLRNIREKLTLLWRRLWRQNYSTKY